MELKNCPFCGSSRMIPARGGDPNHAVSDLVIKCDDCGARGPTVLSGYAEIQDKIPEAEKKWNTRKRAKK